ncbi:GDP-L-fucose synthase [Afifella sp. IM 167]|uniref:GDP-L-fucose synthase family protein n=1 Tax=Afifella sp. IM 167 TaxID=2033586 RepID=UPI001CCAF768|nr:GDP-L-fucose synthase [Afifella sp. IM 167]MBZ8134439.1 GDP-fucose synthetase [Afifella sp. IM 167]
MGPDANTFALAGKRIWVAGHTGLVGSALMRRLAEEPCELLTVPHCALDLTRQAETESWVRRARPDAVILAAARVGGIVANSASPAEFLYDNAMINMNVIHASFEAGVEKLLCLGSSCIYPRDAPQPLAERMLLTGPLEKTNEAYSLAKIAALKLAAAYNVEHGCNFISAMPCNLYGPNDNYDPVTSHVLPALIRKVHEARCTRARTITLWGSGRPLREFMHVDDLADACVFLLRHHSDPEPINVGTMQEISIRDLAVLIAEVVGWEGEFVFDLSMPDGTPRKVLDTRRLNAMGWRPRIDLRTGVRQLYDAWRASEAAPAPAPLPAALARQMAS